MRPDRNLGPEQIDLSGCATYDAGAGKRRRARGYFERSACRGAAGVERFYLVEVGGSLGLRGAVDEDVPVGGSRPDDLETPGFSRAIHAVPGLPVNIGPLKHDGPTLERVAPHASAVDRCWRGERGADEGWLRRP